MFRNKIGLDLACRGEKVSKALSLLLHHHRCWFWYHGPCFSPFHDPLVADFPLKWWERTAPYHSTSTLLGLQSYFFEKKSHFMIWSFVYLPLIITTFVSTTCTWSPGSVLPHLHFWPEKRSLRTCLFIIKTYNPWRLT